LSGLKATTDDLLEFANAYTGPRNDFAFAVYHRRGRKVYVVCASASSPSPITPPSEGAAQVPQLPQQQEERQKDEEKEQRQQQRQHVAADDMDGIVAGVGNLNMRGVPESKEPDSDDEVPLTAVAPSSDGKPRLFMGRRSFVVNAEAVQDLYETPTYAVEKLIVEALRDAIPAGSVIWEPCHGNGRISDTLAAAGYSVIKTDLFTLPVSDSMTHSHETCMTPLLTYTISHLYLVGEARLSEV